MRIDGDAVVFKSTPDNYEKEASGRKPYTIREFRLWSEMREIEYFIEGYNQQQPNKIVVIENTHTREAFTRTITDITRHGCYYIFAWRPE